MEFSEKLKKALDEKDYELAHKLLSSEIERLLKDESLLSLRWLYSDIINTEEDINISLYRLMHLYEKITKKESDNH